MLTSRFLRTRRAFRRTFAVALTVGSIAAGLFAFAGVDLDDRDVASLLAVERVYWDARLWPEHNPTTKPSFDAVADPERTARRLDDVRRMARALEALWHRPATASDVQTEIDRVFRDTRDPAGLRRLTAALGGDAEAFARAVAWPALVERRARGWYAEGTRFHGGVRAAAHAGRRVLLETPMLTDGSGLGARTFAFAHVVRGPSDSGRDALEPRVFDELVAELRERFDLDRDAALPLGTPSRVIGTSTRLEVVVLDVATAERIEGRSFIWEKLSFDAWWNSARGRFGEAEFPTGPYALASTDSPENACADDTWSANELGVTAGRWGHTAVWTGAEMVIWAGRSSTTDLDTGSRYDPVTDTWTDITTVGVPAPRRLHTSVWTGTEMVAWGGTAGNSGGRYDPATDQWSPTSLTGAPSSRTEHTAIWTGSVMVVWGGTVSNTGGRYDPVADTWSATTTVGAPSGRDSHTAVWTGSEMIVWGGTPGVDTGGRYDPVGDAWTATSVTGAPAARQQHSAVWDGSLMLVWGGEGTTAGGRYDPATDSWSPMTTMGAPTPRNRARSVWTGDAMLVWGGNFFDGTVFAEGALYDPVSDAWTPVSTTDEPEPRLNHTLV